MFHSARLTLTAWYLGMIMLISILFSMVIYQGAASELARLDLQQRIHIERLKREFWMRPDIVEIFEVVPVDEIRKRIVTILILINGGILVVSGAVGYFLAGKTLAPIHAMVMEQHRFITDASHELRTPLSALTTEIEVGLLDKNLTLKQTRQLLISNLEEVNNMKKLSNELLDLATLQKPNDLVFESLPLPSIINEAVKNMMPLAKQKHIEFEVTSAPLIIEADKNRLRQLLVIFLDNAVKYSSAHSTVAITAKGLNNKVKIEISDTGIGIHVSDISRIFDRLYRADTSRTKEVKGYGLGLSIAKYIIDIHHGSVSVKSRPNKGTKFTMLLPLKQHTSLFLDLSKS
jgi:two-component system, OmpR family, sensor histidine kinase CiaH